MVRDSQKHLKNPFLLKVLKKWILLFQYGRDPFRDPCLRNRTVTQQDSRLTASTVMLCWVRNEVLHTVINQKNDSNQAGSKHNENLLD